VIDRYPRSAFAERARQQIGQSTLQSTVPSDSLAQAEADYARAYTTWEAGGQDRAVQQFIEVATRHSRTPIAAKALWAATTVVLQARADQVRTPDSVLPLVFGRVLEAPDTTAVLQANRLVEGDLQTETPPTLGDLLHHIATQYPETPQAQRAEQLQQILDAQAATSPATADSARTDSVTADVASDTDSLRTDSLRVDSSAVDPTLNAPPADSAAVDSPAVNPIPADSATADSASAAAGSSAWIIVSTHATEADAARTQREYAARVQHDEISLRVQAVTAAGETRFQVAMGPFPNQAEATAAQDRHGAWLPATARVVVGMSP
jgi:hypothetical protein